MPGFDMSNTMRHSRPVPPSSQTCNTVANALSTTDNNPEIPEIPEKAVKITAEKKAPPDTVP